MTNSKSARKEIGLKIKEIREKKSLTQEDVAKMTGMKTILYQKNLSSGTPLADATINSMFGLLKCLKELHT